MNRKIEKISVDMNEERLIQHLEIYAAKALELGATRSRVIKAQDIPVDERIPLKCQIPRCFGYGAGAHCPPNTLKPDELREHLEKYRWAVLFIKDIPSSVIVRDKATIKERVSAYQKSACIRGAVLNDYLLATCEHILHEILVQDAPLMDKSESALVKYVTHLFVCVAPFPVFPQGICIAV